MKHSWSRLGVCAAAMVMIMSAVQPSYGEDAKTSAAPAADDTGRNVRDRDGDTLTADKQSNDKGDVELTRRVRQEIVKNDALSTNAHNVKIISEDGVVTLRGPVASAEEKSVVAKTAAKVAGVAKVDNQLEVAKP